MRTASHHAAVQALLEREDILTAEDFFSACPGLPSPTVYSKIRSLVQSGRLSAVGKGQYLSVHKPVYHPEISPWMREINTLLIKKCEGTGFCITQREGNLFIYASKGDIPLIIQELQKEHRQVVLAKDWRRLPVGLEGFIVLDRLITESPALQESGVNVPSLEKELVDRICDSREAPDLFSIQKIMEVYPVNLNRLNRFAARRGAEEQIAGILQGLNQGRLTMMNQVQRYLAGIPVVKAWVFGSFARGEETAQSDLDLLVDYDKAAKLSLLDAVRFKLDLEKIIGREVDLIENGSLKPFAVPSAEHDKYLIYER
jgi:predicted nucleotidyltransferase